MLFWASIVALAFTTGLLEGSQPVRLGDPAPPLTVPQLMNAPSGAVATWPVLRGQAVVLEFWATWCAPCVEQIPHLNKLAEQFRDSKVLFLSVTYEDAVTVSAFTAQRPIAGWIGIDTGRRTTRTGSTASLRRSSWMPPACCGGSRGRSAWANRRCGNSWRERT
jgi:thiol-disulfide isomerase/thioredoxin